MKTMQEHARDECDLFIERVHRLKHEAQLGKGLTSDPAARILLTNHQAELGSLEAMARDIKSYVMAGLVTELVKEPATLAEVRERVAAEGRRVPQFPEHCEDDHACVSAS